MTISYQHLFGSDAGRNGLTGYTTVDTDPSGSVSQGGTYVEMISDDATINTLGIYKSSSMIAEIDGLYYEVWFSAESDGNFGVQFNNMMGLRLSSGGFGLNYSNGYKFFYYRISGTGTTLDNVGWKINGSNFLDGTLDITKAVSYKYKHHCVDNTVTRAYLDGGDYANEEILSGSAADYTGDWYDAYQAYQTIGTGDNGSYRVYAAFVHDEGLNFDPFGSTSGGSTRRDIRRRRILRTSNKRVTRR